MHGKALSVLIDDVSSASNELRSAGAQHDLDVVGSSLRHSHC